MKSTRVMGLLFFVAAQTAWAGSVASGSAQYLVPGAPGGTPDTYTVGQASIDRVPGGMRVLSFTLPEDLVGQGGEQFTLKEEPAFGGFLSFASPSVSASCILDGSHGTCVMKYAPDYGAELDRGAIDSFLGVKYASDPATLSSALLRSRDFQRDPEGVLIF